MADYFNPNEFRASSSAFQWGDIVFTHYKTGCLRKILIQSRNHQAPINPKYTEIGAVNEDRHEVRLREEGKTFIREFDFKSTVPTVDGVTFSGHIDFLHTDGTNPTMVDELKSVTSKNVKREVIKNGMWVPENLAQTVGYMGEAKVSKGRLIYTYYEQDTNNQKWYALDERTFHVTVDDFGKVAVDSKPTQYSFYDVLSHRVSAAKVIKDGTVGPRPYRWELQFVSPCTWCPFKKACDKYDEGSIEGTDAFVDYAKQCSVEERKDD